jgi:putative dimethyl sulfoxide reductase chaperone
MAVMTPLSPTVRANMYYALSRAFEAPRLWDEEWPELLAEALAEAPELSPQLREKILRLAEDALVAREATAIAHAKLFLGPFEILVAPWASFYLEPEPKLMGPVSQYAASSYASAGLGPGGALKDAPDHVTHELEFMYYLSFSDAASGESIYHESQVRFWREHLGRWLPRFAEAVVEADVHPLYSTLAETLLALCDAETTELGSAQPGGGGDPTPDN